MKSFNKMASRVAGRVRNSPEFAVTFEKRIKPIIVPDIAGMDEIHRRMWLKKVVKNNNVYILSA